MLLLLLLLLYLACMAGSWPKPPGLDESIAGMVWAGLLSWGAIGLGVLAAMLAGQRVRELLRADPHQRESVVRRYGPFRAYHPLILFVLYLLALYVFGWGWVVGEICTVKEWGIVLPGAELLLLAPLLVGMVLSWVFYYDAERALYETAHPLVLLRPFWSRSAYVSFHVRQSLAMVLVPVANLIVLQGVGRLHPRLFDQLWFQGLLFVLLVVQVICLPWIMRFALGMQPLPAGPLRDRLRAAARRLNFRCSDIMLWNTRNGVANGLVVGVFPWLRYVVLSDRLLDELTPDEAEAVFGHEVGHVKHHHMLYYLGFLFVSLAVLANAWDLVRPHLLAGESGLDWITPLLVGSLGTYIFVVFGFLSRRCERQADIYGCRAVSCGRPDCTGHENVALPAEGKGLCRTGIHTFIRALEKVASINGMVRSTPKWDMSWPRSPVAFLLLIFQVFRFLLAWLQTWQHSTVERRVKFLQAMEADPTLEPRFQRRVGLVKWAMILVLIALLGALQLVPPGNPPENARPGAAGQPAVEQW